MRLKTAMILAAGRGERLKPLTDTTPKPLLPVLGKPLIAYHLEKLAALHFEKVVINVHYLAKQLMDALGDGSKWGVQIVYSQEQALLGTGGSIRQALDLLGSEPFLCMGGDIYTDFPLEKFVAQAWSLEHYLMHAVLTDKRPHAKGDFSLTQNQVVAYAEHPNFAYASIAILDPKIFCDHACGHATLMSFLQPIIAKGLVRGEYYPRVMNINTLEEYHMLQ